MAKRKTKPIVAVVGRPNVGKSTLFNALAGENISIVKDTPGITRDRIYADIHWLDMTFTLIDTGGIEPDSKDVILSQMREQAEIAMETADVIIFLVDVKQGLVDADSKVADMLRRSHKPVVLVVNKVDSFQKYMADVYEFYNLGIGDPHPISAVNRLGIGDMLEAVTEYFDKEQAEEEEDDRTRVAIVGKPNVGKSSLINKLLGENRLIVSDIAGTTRDAVDTEITYNGKEYVFIDTAGLRRKNKIKEELERYMIVRTVSAVERAEVVVLMIDAEEGVTEQDAKIAGIAHERGKATIIVVNKWDAIEKDDKTIYKFTEKVRNTLSFMPYAELLFVSAKTGQRLPKLFETIDIVSENHAMRVATGVLNEIGNALCAFFAEKGIQPYSEETGRGLVRHIFLRRGAHSGQIMVCLVCTRAKLPSAEELCTRLKAQFAEITTILLNVNAKNTNVILGTETHTLYGPGYIEDTLCGVPVQLGPLSFYQVNTLAAEQLYGIAAQYAQLTPDDLLLDLYCGMGTIGLSMAAHCRELIGVEIVPEAIESAKANAARMGADVAAKSRFFCADAGQAATRLAAEGLHPDIVMLDPPRKGCDEATLSAVVRMSPRRVVYVSCNPATAARDAAWLEQNGYHAEKVQPVDLFPRTRHCEAVLLLTKLHVERHIEVDVSMDELDVTAAESKATYNEIRDYVWEHYQLKVSNLYIAQVKQKYGIIERENYHKAKNENAKQPQCPKEKEDAIVEALKHFQMI